VQFDPTFRDDMLNDRVWQQAMIDVVLPAPGRYGTLRVVREAVQTVLLYGQRLTFPQPIPWTRLDEGNTLWMSDTPQERLMMVRGTTGMYGHILVAGGGLGLYPQYLRRYQPVDQITIVERHADVVELLQATLAADPAIEIIHGSFEQFIFEQHARTFDSCYIDIHPTLDPRWMPGMNWLRDQCAAIVAGPLRIWGYQWMAREFVKGLEREYIPLLRRDLHFDNPLGRDLRRALPSLWQRWSDAQLHAWLMAYSYRSAWPLEWSHLRAPHTAAA
jgi:hypothetical protein